MCVNSRTSALKHQEEWIVWLWQRYAHAHCT